LQNRLSTKLTFLAKLSLSLGLISYLVWILDWETAAETITKAAKFPLFVAPFFVLAGFGFASFRWQLILADSKVDFSYWNAYLGYLVGSFYSVFLPGVIGGDAVRIARCAKQTKCQLGVVTGSVLLERTSGFVALLTIAFLVYLGFPQRLSPLLAIQARYFMTAVTVVGVIVIALVLLRNRFRLNWLPQEGKGRLWTFVRSAIQTFVVPRRRTLGIVLILSALFQTMDIVVTFILSQAIGLPLPLIVFLAVIPLVYLATVLPISLGGLGVREGTLVLLLAQFGVVPSDAVTLSFLVYLNRVVIGGLGGLVQLAETFSTRKASRVVKDGNYV